MTRSLVVLSMLALVSSSSSCTLLYLFNNDPAGLPCDFSTSDEGKCLAGYVCVKVDDGDPDTEDTQQVCLKAGAKVKGEECARTEECDENLVCDTRFKQCAAGVGGGDDFNCDLVPDIEKKLACRAVCDPTNSDATCNDDEFCVNTGGATPFCQTGACTGDSDCNVDNASGFCVSEGNPPRHIGLCFEGPCDPLSCAAGQCPDCRGVDGVVDESANCVPVLDELVAQTVRTMCDTPGEIVPGEPCNVFGLPCQAGSFCNCNVDSCATGDGLCTAWCHFPSGAPACNAPEACQSIDGSDKGFCF